MIRRVIWMLIMAGMAAAFYYVSRFWGFRLWGRDGLFGVSELPPQGGLMGRWLRGSEFAPFELLFWVLGIFAVLTLLQKIFDWTGPKGD